MSTMHAAVRRIRELPPLPSLLAAALLAAIVLQLFLFIRGALTNFGIPQPGSVGAAASAAVPRQVAAVGDLSLIGRLFGTPADQLPPAESDSSLILTGTFVWNGERSGMAIVGATREDTALYHVGAELPGGLILDRVFADRIVVSRNGVLATILFAPRMPGEGSNAPLVVQEAAQPSNSVLGGFARVVPVRRGAGVAGYKVYPNDDTSAFADLGLRSGDLIVAINGTRLDDPKVAPGLVATLSWASGVAVTVKRGGREKDLVVSTERASSNAAQQRQIQESAASARDPIFHSRRSRSAPAAAAAGDT